MEPFLPTIWSVFHDGVIDRIVGSVPGDLRVSVGIEYLRERFPDEGDEFVVSLSDCKTFSYRPYDSKKVVTDLTAIAEETLSLLSAEMDGETCRVFTDLGVLEMQCSGDSVSLDSGRDVPLDELLSVSAAYWKEWKAKSEARNLKKLVEKLDVEGASKFMVGKSVEELRNLLLAYAFDEKDIRIYTLMVGVIHRDPKWEWHYLVSLILCQPLCNIKGAYFAAYHHALEAIKLSPDDPSLKEYVLFFNAVPDNPMDDALAKSVAEEMLKLDPDNQAANRTLGK